MTAGRPVPLGVAVSGGPDSLALLLLAVAAFPGEVRAATVDHGLRPEGAAEAAFVARCCLELGVPHDILPVEIAPGNVSDRARVARYEALARWATRNDMRHIATAHHADDQAETLMMRLNRGSGVAGLAGVRRSSEIAGASIVRPLLSWRKRDLAQLVVLHGWKAIDDPSNRDPRYDRARMRAWLAKDGMLDIPAIAGSADHLAEADEAIAWASAHAFDRRVSREADRLVIPCDLPRAIALRVILRILAEFGSGDVRIGQVARLHDSLASGMSTTLGEVIARSENGAWRFERAPPRRS